MRGYTNVRVSISTKVLQEMKLKLNKTNYSEVTQEALSLLKWAMDQRLDGYSIMSGDNIEGNEVITTPGLSFITNKNNNKLIENRNDQAIKLLNELQKNIEENETCNCAEFSHALALKWKKIKE